MNTGILLFQRYNSFRRFNHRLIFEMFFIVQDGRSNLTFFFDTYGSKTDPSIYRTRWAGGRFCLLHCPHVRLTPGITGLMWVLKPEIKRLRCQYFDMFGTFKVIFIVL